MINAAKGSTAASLLIYLLGSGGAFLTFVILELYNVL